VIRILLLCCLIVVLLPAPAKAERYKSTDAGHPLQIVAYILHPVGVILDRLIFYPAWRIAQNEPIRSLVGMKRVESDEGEAIRARNNPFLEPYVEKP